MRNTESEGIKATGEERLDAESGQALLGDDGLLGGGARLGFGLADAAATEMLRLTEPGTDPSKKPEKLKLKLEDGTPNVTPLEPPTIKQELRAVADKLVKERAWRDGCQEFENP